MRFKYLATAVVAAATLVTGAVAAAGPAFARPAGHHQVLIGGDIQKRHFSGRLVCSLRPANQNPGCMAADGTLGDVVKSKVETVGNDEMVDATIQSSQCNSGLVNSTCPFASGLGLNTHFSSDEIDVLNRHDNSSDLFFPNFTGLEVHQVNGNGGQNLLVVIHGDCGGLTQDCLLVAVDASNDLNTTNQYYAICDEGTGSALELEVETIGTAVPNRCHWFIV